MATIRLKFAELGSPRFHRLQTALSASREHTLGALLIFLASTEEEGIESGTMEQIARFVTGYLSVDDLLHAGYVAEGDDGLLCIPMHKGLVARKAKRLEISRNALAAREAKRGKKPVKERVRKSKALVAEEAPTAPLWEAYKEGYFHRYGTYPVWNAKAGGILKQVIQRIGREDAPHVLRFWLDHHTKKFYLDRMFSLQCFLGDCEGLSTQWKRGKVMDDSLANHVSSAMTYEQEQADILAGRL